MLANVVANVVAAILIFAAGYGLSVLVGWLTHKSSMKSLRSEMEDLRNQIADLESANDAGDEENGANGGMSDTVDFIGATAIVNAYIEPAMVGKRAGIGIGVTQDLLDQFGETTGARVGEYEYNRVLLHQWIESNAAKFLVKYRGEMS